MTDPVDKVSVTKEVERRNTRSGFIKNEKKKRHPDGAGSDSVDISEEARDRASGKG